VLPIMTLQPEGDRVLVFDAKETEVNAVKAVHLRNTTDTVLTNGVVAILEGGRFMGQADFTPMLPNDDQLIPYGEDTSVSITRTFPKGSQSNEVERLEPITTEVSQTAQISGIKVIHKQQKVTRYSLKNNSTSKAVGKFYIEHSASTDHGGFVITTEGSTKEATGWARFEITLEPLEERVLDVAEAAHYSRDISSAGPIKTFLNAKSTADLQESGILSEDLLAALQKVVDRERLRDIYRKIERNDISEKEFRAWQQEGELHEEAGGLLRMLVALRKAEADTAELKRQLSIHQAHVKKVFMNQERLRSNIQSLEKVTNTALVERYLKDLDKEEDDLIATNNVIDQLEEEQVSSQNLVKERLLELTTAAANLRAGL